MTTILPLASGICPINPLLEFSGTGPSPRRPSSASGPPVRLSLCRTWRVRAPHPVHLSHSMTSAVFGSRVSDTRSLLTFGHATPSTGAPRIVVSSSSTYVIAYVLQMVPRDSIPRQNKSGLLHPRTHYPHVSMGCICHRPLFRVGFRLHN